MKRKKTNAHFYFLPVYFDVETHEIQAGHFIFDWILDFLIWFDVIIATVLSFFSPDYEYQFRIDMKKEVVCKNENED